MKHLIHFLMFMSLYSFIFKSYRAGRFSTSVINTAVAELIWCSSHSGRGELDAVIDRARQHHSSGGQSGGQKEWCCHLKYVMVSIQSIDYTPQ